MKYALNCLDVLKKIGNRKCFTVEYIFFAAL